MKRVLLILPVILLSVLFISCEKQVSVNQPEEPVHLGKIYIDSNPSGAKIIFDNEDIGRFAPDSIRFIKEGDHKITLKLNDYRDTTFYIKVKESAPVRMMVDYTQNEAMKSIIVCKSVISKCAIYLDGKFTGKYTPDTLKAMLPGSYCVKYIKTGYWDDSSKTSIKSGGVYTVDFSLTDTSNWVTFDKKHKLPSDFINCVHIDSRDIKWIGTNDEGLVRFDGIKSVVYNTGNSGIKDNCINAIVSDSRNNLWIGTLNGIVKYDGTNWVNYNTSNSPIPSDHIVNLSLDKDGSTIWIGTSDKGIASFNGASWAVFNAGNSGLGDNHIKLLQIDSKGNKWIGTYLKGLKKFDGSKWTSYEIPDAMYIKVIPVSEFVSDTLRNSNNISALLIQENGEMFLGLDKMDRDGNYIYQADILYYPSSDEPFKFYRSTFSAASIAGSTCIAQDINGNKWITTPSGFYKITGGTTSLSGKKYTKSNSPIKDDNTTSVVIDRHGYKWITSSYGGLIKLKGD